ncbi:MAG TPA: carboxypeptidase-like regulatory domain-containing protein [Candidatus Kapabacteria bacterium]|nr:carboxypeptidase-like regulatory domain-containing protein [Candidatus Kapabacteria bacterium]
MNIRSVVILLAAVVWLGCSDSNGSNDNGNSDLTGDLTGKITLTDYRGYAKADKSGVLVQLDGTSYSAISDTGGAWTIHNLPSKTYSLTFSKTGYSTWKDRSYSFTGGGVVRYHYINIINRNIITDFIVPMAELPLYSIVIDALLLPKVVYSDSAKSNITIPGTLYGHSSPDAPNNSNYSLSALIISSKKSSLSLEDNTSYNNEYFYTSNSGDWNFYSLSAHDTIVNFTVTRFNQLLQGFSSGDTVYFRAYPGIGYNSYYDAIEDKVVPIGISNNGSNVLSAIVP